MAIIIEPDEVKAPADWTEEQTEAAITITMAYARLSAPCLESLEGDKQVVAKDLLIKLVNLYIEGEVEPPSLSGRLSIGPFSLEEGGASEAYQKKLMGHLKRLCGINDNFAVIQLKQKTFRNPHIWSVDTVNPGYEDFWNRV